MGKVIDLAVAKRPHVIRRAIEDINGPLLIVGSNINDGGERDVVIFGHDLPADRIVPLLEAALQYFRDREGDGA